MSDEQIATMKARAAADQLREGIKDIAALTHAYYVSLVESGFHVKEALSLTMDWHRAFWAAQFARSKTEQDD